MIIQPRLLSQHTSDPILNKIDSFWYSMFYSLTFMLFLPRLAPTCIISVLTNIRALQHLHLSLPGYLRLLLNRSKYLFIATHNHVHQYALVYLRLFSNASIFLLQIWPSHTQITHIGIFALDFERKYIFICIFDPVMLKSHIGIIDPLLNWRLILFTSICYCKSDGVMLRLHFGIFWKVSLL